MKPDGIYVRVSSRDQQLTSQLPDLRAWEKAQEQPARWFEDKMTGKSMKRPGLEDLIEQARLGHLKRMVVWRLDRLGRTARGVLNLLGDLEEWGVGFLSLKEGFDVQTPMGRAIVGILASLAQWETEVRGERVAAGIAAARARGETWGGSQVGRRLKVTEEKEQAVRDLRAAGQSIAAIARQTGLARQTVYTILGDHSG